MTPALWLSNIGAFALQLAAIIGAGLVLSQAVQVGRPRAALAYWRLVLLACLLLPLAQPWTAAAPRPGPATAVSTPTARDGTPSAGQDGIETAHTRWNATGLVLVALGTGVAARGLWLVIGAVSLVRLRRAATPLEPVPPAFADAQARLGVRATIAVADRVSGPITFGLVRPIVIVPPSVLELGADVQEAIACHELLHVRRRDWVDEIAEEVIRTVFWFHPAVWWLVDRIQLSREQVVDQEAIALTASRERYVQALVSVALARRSIALVPAPLFLRRSHLKQRITRILQETTMTTRRMIASLTLSSAAIGLSAVLAVRAFPLQAEAQPLSGSSNGDPVSIVKGGDHLLHAALPEYPRRALEQKVEGDVVLEATLDERGEVADARVLSGPDELRKASLESVLNWHYAPAALRSISTEVTLRFHLPAPNAEFEETGHAYQEETATADKIAQATEVKEIAPEPRANQKHLMAEIERALGDPSLTDGQKDELKAKYAESKMLFEKLLSEPEPDDSVFGKAEPPRLVQVRSERVSNDVLRAVMARSGVKIGDTMDEYAAKRFAETAASVDEHLRVSFRGGGKGGLVIVVLLP
jgi:TonB family protein